MADKMSNAEYRQKEGLSSTDLKRMVKSPAYYKYMLDNPTDNDSPALLFGRAVHKWVLEPSDFYNEFAVAPNCDRRTKEGKETWNKFVADSEGKDVITEADFEKIQKMRDSIYATPFARKLLMGQHEESFFWTDERTGLECKCRPDSFGKVGNQHICVDLKTCALAETSAFMKDAIKFNYDLQAAHYCEGLQTNFGHDFQFVFVAVEKEAPYLTNILVADDLFMKSGSEVREAMLDLYKKCVEKDEWCGYLGFRDSADMNEISLPAWMRKAFEDVKED